MYEVDNIFEVWVVATIPCVEKIINDTFYYSEKEAKQECDLANSRVNLECFKVYRAFISIDRGIK